MYGMYNTSFLLAVNEVTYNIFEVTNERLTAASRRVAFLTRFYACVKKPQRTCN